jgi:hypothetical protein
MNIGVLTKGAALRVQPECHMVGGGLKFSQELPFDS